MKKILLAIICLLFLPAVSHAANGDITAIRIVGQATTIADASSSCNVDRACNGWALEIDTTGLASGGTYNTGISTSTQNTPINAKIVCTTDSHGYDETGSAATTTRTIYGTSPLRRVYSALYAGAQYPTDSTVSGGTLTLRFSLSDYVYSQDLNTTCSVAAGLYTSAGTPTNATSSVIVRNLSTIPYPRAIANWSYPPDTITGSSFKMRAVAFSRHAVNKRPVAVVKFTATDQHSHTVSQFVTDPTIYDSLGDASKVVEYIATIPTTTFTPSDTITMNFIAYPQIGTSTSLIDTSDGVNTQPTPLYAPITALYDDGTYGSSAAVVGPAGKDSTCVAVADSAFNPLAPPAYCASINGAIVAISTRNLAQYGRNDAVGSIYMQATTSAQWTGASNSCCLTTSKGWGVLKPFPGLTRDDVTIIGVTGVQSFGATKIKIQNITFNVATAPTSIFQGIATLWLDHSCLTSNGTAPINVVTVYYVTDGCVGNLSGGLKGFSNTLSMPILIRGNDLTGINGGMIYTMIGNVTRGGASQSNWFDNYSGQPNTVASSTELIFAYNQMYRSAIGSAQVVTLRASLNHDVPQIGTAIVQNLIEYNSTANQPLLWICGDSCVADDVNNVLLMNNTLVGDRVNRAYNSTGSLAKMRTLWSERNELTDQENIKTDSFTAESGANAGRVGNWAVLYGVGRRAGFDNETTGVGAAGSFQMEFSGINTYVPTVNYTVNPLTSGTNAASNQQFYWRTAYNGVGNGLGNGNYQLQRISPVINYRNAVQAGDAILPYDLAGMPWRNDGTDVPGAFNVSPYGFTAQGRFLTTGSFMNK